MHIGGVLAAKTTPGVVTIRPDAGVRELLTLLAEHNIGAVIVSSDGVGLDGIVSERDVVRRLHHDGAVLDHTVEALMTPSVTTCTAEDDLDSVMQAMTDQRIRHLPVLAGDTVVGVISIGDVVKHKIGQLQFERDQLDSYVRGT